MPLCRCDSWDDAAVSIPRRTNWSRTQWSKGAEEKGQTFSRQPPCGLGSQEPGACGQTKQRRSSDSTPAQKYMQHWHFWLAPLRFFTPDFLIRTDRRLASGESKACANVIFRPSRTVDLLGFLRKGFSIQLSGFKKGLLFLPKREVYSIFVRPSSPVLPAGVLPSRPMHASGLMGEYKLTRS